jgi:hypothetical protein
VKIVFLIYDPMKKRTCVFLVFIVCQLLFSTSTFGQNVVVPALTNSRTIDGENYRCGQMVESLNLLRHLGKDEALKCLEKYCHESMDANFDTIYICMLLFKNPDGWKPIGGAHYYRLQIDTNLLDHFPLFPLALSDGIPFYIYRGYNIGGRFDETGLDYCKLCQGFQMITNDITNMNFTAAAKDLFKDEKFQKLYFPEDEVEEIKSLVMDQTGIHDSLQSTNSAPSK